jgi:FtsH-binding integral membrane protein
MPVPEVMPKRIQMAYQDALDNIAFLKRQQWIITNYSFVSFASLFFLCKETHPNGSIRFLIVFVIVVVASYCIAILSSFEDGMKKFRSRLD